MTKFDSVVYLSLCGALGLAPESHSIDWESVFMISMQQNVIALVYVALLKDRCGCPEDIFEAIEANALGHMLRNEDKIDKANGLLREAYRQGLKMGVMKGIIISQCYDDPLTRFSKDLDLITEKKEKKHALKFIELQGEKRIDSNKYNGHYGFFWILCLAGLNYTRYYMLKITRICGPLMPKCSMNR